MFLLDDWHIALTVEPLSDAAVLIPRQTHGSVIVRAADFNSRQPVGDGIVVDVPGVHVGIRTADCMPLVVLSRAAAAVLHVSRKTLVAGLLEALPQHVGPSTITSVYIGPFICSEHFTFSWEGDELAVFHQRFPFAFHEQDGVISLSLREVVASYLAEWGVDDSRVHEHRACTFEDADLPSYRRHLSQGGSGAPSLELVTSVWRDS